MNRVRRLVVVTLPLLTGCGWSLPSDPKHQTAFDGVKYTAVTNEITHPQGGLQFIIVATLENTTNASVTRTYPAACAVSIRLYREADDALLYDETRRECNTTPTVTVTIAAHQTVELSSGVRFPSTLAGDSLPFTTYNVWAVPRSEGTRVFEIRAGTMRLRTSAGG